MTYTNTPRLTLISHNLCPYVQRAAIALEEMGIEYHRVDIDLDDPPDWFRQLSPLGKVPLLRINNEDLLFESAVIAEYVNELGNGELLSNALIERARQRAWIEFASATLDNIGALYSVSGDHGFTETAHATQRQMATAGGRAWRRRVFQRAFVFTGGRRLCAGVPLHRSVRADGRNTDNRRLPARRGLALPPVAATIGDQGGATGLPGVVIALRCATGFLAW